MKIQLLEWKVKNLSFKMVQSKRRRKSGFNLSMGNFYPELDRNKFGVGLLVKIKDEDYDLNVEMVFMFETNVEINKQFVDSDFPKVNAPAIAFPYIRAFISNFTMQAGFSPIVLPSINFVEYSKKKQQEPTKE